MKTRVHVHEYGSTIVLPCGLVVEGRPQNSVSYAETARDVGYGDGPDAALRMCQDHDALHALVCGWLGIPESYSLRMTVGAEADLELAAIEEAAVMALQKLMMRGGGRMPS